MSPLVMAVMVDLIIIPSKYEATLSSITAVQALEE